jgi:NNP family nitrate/nitrite transporter-like MFS transporter
MKAANTASDTRISAALGFSAAWAAYGAFLIPASFGIALAQTGSAAAALIAILFFYLTCISITWWYYARRNAPIPC